MIERLQAIVLFSLGSKDFDLLAILLWIFISAALFFVHSYIQQRLLPLLISRSVLIEKQKKRIVRLTRGMFILFFLSLSVWVLHLNYDLIVTNNNKISILMILAGLVILQIARIVDWLITQYIIHNNFIKRDQARSKENLKPDPESRVNRTVQFLVYVLAIIILLRKFSLDQVLYTFKLGEEGEWRLKITNIFAAIFILLLGRLSIWVITQIIMYGYYKQKNIDLGSRYAINRLITYVIYVVSFIVALESLGFKMTLIWGGAAALLVGIGLGLQQTFNDFFSGLVILFERSIQVGDVLDINGQVGRVKKIGLRASLFDMRESYTMIIPNSKLVNNQVLNWSTQKNKARFVVKTSVAYGTDTEKVKGLLIQAAKESDFVLKTPIPFSRFVDFGDSGLLFELHFFSKHLMTIEDVKSELRLKIDLLFRENKITVPFPQRDLWIKKEE
jgi:small-conductance mechanosensitive channel